MAIQRRKPKPGVIHHSDGGVQYLCTKYVKKLKDHGLHISCSSKGNPYDNSWTESFMKTLKDNEVYMWAYETYLDVVDRGTLTSLKKFTTKSVCTHRLGI